MLLRPISAPVITGRDTDVIWTPPWWTLLLICPLLTQCTEQLTFESLLLGSLFLSFSLSKSWTKKNVLSTLETVRCCHGLLGAGMLMVWVDCPSRRLTGKLTSEQRNALAASSWLVVLGLWADAQFYTQPKISPGQTAGTLRTDSTFLSSGLQSPASRCRVRKFCFWLWCACTLPWLQSTMVRGLLLILCVTDCTQVLHLSSKWCQTANVRPRTCEVDIWRNWLWQIDQIFKEYRSDAKHSLLGWSGWLKKKNDMAD